LSIDTYLVIPAGNPTRAGRLLADAGDEVTRAGRDYIVLYKGELFAEVERAPATWGPRYVQDLPPSVRRGLDARGLLARPEVGQSFDFESYTEAVDAEGPSLWLPLRAARRRRTKRLLLVALSPEREAMVLEHPELVHELLAARATTSIPGLLELDEVWIELQRLLFDCLWLERGDDERADALAPRSGLTLLEDESVDAARLMRADRARATAEWLLTLSPEVIERARSAPPSPASRRFPESLGAAPADDHEPIRGPASSAPSNVKPALGEHLKPLSAFYAEVQRAGHAVLSVRFRE
jgi:hypothetical protein